MGNLCNHSQEADSLLATRILIVSDDARGRDRPINRRLEAALKVLGAAFSVTEPLAVAEPA